MVGNEDCDKNAPKLDVKIIPVSKEELRIFFSKDGGKSYYNEKEPRIALRIPTGYDADEKDSGGLSKGGKKGTNNDRRLVEIKNTMIQLQRKLLCSGTVWSSIKLKFPQDTSQQVTQLYTWDAGRSVIVAHPSGIATDGAAKCDANGGVVTLEGNMDGRDGWLRCDFTLTTRNGEKINMWYEIIGGGFEDRLTGEVPNEIRGWLHLKTDKYYIAYCQGNDYCFCKREGKPCPDSPQYTWIIEECINPPCNDPWVVL